MVALSPPPSWLIPPSTPWGAGLEHLPPAYTQDYPPVVSSITTLDFLVLPCPGCLSSSRASSCIPMPMCSIPLPSPLPSCLIVTTVRGHTPGAGILSHSQTTWTVFCQYSFPLVCSHGQFHKSSHYHYNLSPVLFKFHCWVLYVLWLCCLFPRRWIYPVWTIRDSHLILILVIVFHNHIVTTRVTKSFSWKWYKRFSKIYETNINTESTFLTT